MTEWSTGLLDENKIENYSDKVKLKRIETNENSNKKCPRSTTLIKQVSETVHEKGWLVQIYFWLVTWNLLIAIMLVHQ